MDSLDADDCEEIERSKRIVVVVRREREVGERPAREVAMPGCEERVDMCYILSVGDISSIITDEIVKIVPVDSDASLEAPRWKAMGTSFARTCKQALLLVSQAFARAERADIPDLCDGGDCLFLTLPKLTERGEEYVSHTCRKKLEMGEEAYKGFRHDDEQLKGELVEGQLDDGASRDDEYTPLDVVYGEYILSLHDDNWLTSSAIDIGLLGVGEHLRRRNRNHVWITHTRWARVILGGIRPEKAIKNFRDARDAGQKLTCFGFVRCVGNNHWVAMYFTLDSNGVLRGEVMDSLDCRRRSNGRVPMVHQTLANAFAEVLRAEWRTHGLEGVLHNDVETMLLRRLQKA